MDKKLKQDLISQKSDKSSIRWALIQIINFIKISIYGTLGILFFEVLRGQSPDWNGVAKFFGALGVILSIAIGSKAYQKKNESSTLN